MRFRRASLACRPATLGLVAAAILCVLPGGWGTAVAQDNLTEADKEILRNHQLTIPEIDKLEAVVRKIVSAAKADPLIRKEMESLGAEQNVSIATINATFDKLAPRVVAVLKVEGMDPRDFFVSLMSTMFASMAAKTRGSAGFETVQDFVPAGNIAFVEKHRPRVDLLEKALSEWDDAGKAE